MNLQREEHGSQRVALLDPTEASFDLRRQREECGRGWPLGWKPVKAVECSNRVLCFTSVPNADTKLYRLTHEFRIIKVPNESLILETNTIDNADRWSFVMR